MDMEEYKATFLRERISGNFLAACTQTTLKHYLKVTNQQHLLQIQRIIAGDISAKELLSQYH